MTVFDTRTRAVDAHPFAHVIDSDFIEPSIYEALRESFPQCPPSTGPSGHSLFWHDDGYQSLLAQQPVWRKLCDAFHSQDFIDWAVEQFAPVWKRHRCRIDPHRARYVAYHEDRIDKERAKLRRVEHEPDELWVRMDIHQGKVGYARRIHRDHARRLLTMLIYFCDHGRSGLEGGELVLHGPAWKRWLATPVKVAPRENLMIAFPCSAPSYHSVTPLASLEKPRNYLQIHISSSVDLWKHRFR